MALRESGEDYLETILMLQQERGAVRAVDIATHLNVTKASVSKALSTLETNGYVEVVRRDVRLTDKGMRHAEEILERHVFFRDLLTACGVSSETAEEEGCHMEHTLSEESFQLLKAKMGEAGIV